MTSETALAIVKGDVRVRRTDQPIHFYSRSGFIPLPGKATEKQLPLWPGHPVYLHRTVPDALGVVQPWGQWTITDAYTGTRMASGRTRAAALESLNTIVTHLGPDGVVTRAAQRLAETGLSPAFEVIQ